MGYLIKNLKKSAALVTVAGQLLMMAAPAMGANNQSTNALSYDASKMEQKDLDCNSFCSAFTKKNSDGVIDARNEWQANGGKGQVKSLDGSDEWGSSDDQWCAEHGSVTDSSAGPGPKPTFSSTTKCNVPMTTADGTGTDACRTVNEKLIRCKFKNTQAEQHCMAYQAAMDGEAFDWVMLGLDIVAATACTSSCLAENSVIGAVAAPALKTACTVAGIGVGATELISTIAQNNSPVASALKGTLAAAEIAGGAVSGAAQGVNGIAAVGEEGQKMTVQTQKASDVDKAASCITAALFVVQTGVRVASLAMMGGTQENSCKAIRELASGAAIAGGGSGPDINKSNYVPGNGTGGGGGLSGSGGGTGGGPSATQIASDQLACMGGTRTAGCNSNPLSSGNGAATDAGLLTRSGLDKLVAPQAAGLDLDAFKKNLGAGAGSMVSSALGGGAGEFGAALASLAQTSQDNAASLAGGTGSSSYASGSGGGGAGGSKSGGGDNPFANLFGGAGGKDAGARGPTSEQFGKNQISDIWHTGTTQNIFEIVSTKVSHVVSRVGAK